MAKQWMAMALTAAMLLGLAACGQTAENTAADTQAQTVFPLGDMEATYGDTFGQGEVIEIYVELDEADWADILANPMAEEYHSATVSVNGTTAENVGFRTKGNSSLATVASSDSDRYGFRVKIDKYDKQQTLNGLDEFVLNASFADPSYMREYLTYAAMAHLGGVTPYASYANLYINGELFGFYLMIEALDDSFVERHTDDGDANLYKADGQSCTLTERDTAAGFKLSVGEDKEMENVLALIEALNSADEDSAEALEALLDVDSVLRAIAVNTVMGNYDSYSGSMAHNYYLLYADGKFTYVGWDYNMSIGGFNDDYGASVNVDLSEPVYNTSLAGRPLIDKVLAVPEYYDRYMGYVQQLAVYFEDFEQRVDTMADTLRPHIEADPTAFYTMEQFENSIANTGEDLSQREGMGGMRAGREDMELPGDMDNFDFGQLPQGLEDGQLPGDMERPGDGGGPAGPGGMGGFSGDELPEDFQIPGDFDFDGGFGGMGGGMISQEPVSIVDYMLQRLDNIEMQLAA